MATSIYILVGEQEGDYDDFYQRNREPLMSSEDKAALDKFWLGLPVRTRSDGEEFRTIDEEEYISCEIVEVPILF